MELHGLKALFRHIKLKGIILRYGIFFESKYLRDLLIFKAVFMHKDAQLHIDKSRLINDAKHCCLSLNLSLTGRFIVTFAYFLLIFFSTQFDIPDNYNLLAGLPAGLALVILVIAGARLSPFIWLAAFTADLLFYADENLAIDFTALLTAFVTASATVMQALIGNHLAQPFIKRPASIASIMDTMRLLFLIGPFACLIATTIKTFALYQFHEFPTSDIFPVWVTGYVHDTLAVLLLAPIMLARHGMNIGNGWHSRIAATTASLFLAAVLLLSGLHLLNQNEIQNARLTFEDYASELAYQIKDTFFTVKTACGRSTV